MKVSQTNFGSDLFPLCFLGNQVLRVGRKLGGLWSQGEFSKNSEESDWAPFPGLGVPDEILLSLGLWTSGLSFPIP